MSDFFQRLLQSDFMPHGHCYQWLPDIVWLHAVSDGLITVAYYAIPFLLLYFVRKRTDIAFKSVFMLFGAFILLCGTTHLLEIWSIWHGTYRLTGVVKLATAGVSVATAVVMVQMMPAALRLPSPAQMEDANVALRERTRALEAALAELEEKNRTLETTVVALEEARAQVDEALQVKDEFLSRMSHEMRTPLNGVVGLTELMLATDCTTQQEEYAEGVLKASHELLGLVDEVLDFALSRRDELSIVPAPMDVRGLAQAMRDQFKANAKAGVAFSVSVAPDVPAHVMGDRHRVAQVLTGLLSNAVKFTLSGSIRLTAFTVDGKEGRMLRFEVQDTGIGIEPDRLERLFDPFEQEDGTSTRRYGGIGLGLALVRELVTLMGGEVGAVSEKDAGSTFWFTMPCEEAPLTGAPDGPAGDGSLDESFGALRVLVVAADLETRRDLGAYLTAAGCSFTTSTQAAEALEHLTDTPESASYDALLIEQALPGMDGDALARALGALPQTHDIPVILLQASPLSAGTGAPHVYARLSLPLDEVALKACLGEVCRPERRRAADPPAEGAILLAEDVPLNQMVIRMLLERMGYAVDVVNNGAEAVVAAQRRVYGLILMDVQMPGMDGFAATRAIRALDGPAHTTPIIALTADAFAEDRLRCLAEGMDDFLPKPVDTATLRVLLDRWMRQTERRNV